MVRGRFKLHNVASNRHFRFFAVAQDETPKEDRFHGDVKDGYLPGGKLELCMDNPAAASQFEKGKEYYIDITPVESDAAG